MAFQRFQKAANPDRLRKPKNTTSEKQNGKKKTGLSILLFSVIGISQQEYVGENCEYFLK